MVLVNTWVATRSGLPSTVTLWRAVCYVKLSYDDGKIQVSLLIAKSRLAPIKLATIPRLDCGAVLRRLSERNTIFGEPSVFFGVTL